MDFALTSLTPCLSVEVPKSCILAYGENIRSFTCGKSNLFLYSPGRASGVVPQHLCLVG